MWQCLYSSWRCYCSSHRGGTDCGTSDHWTVVADVEVCGGLCQCVCTNVHVHDCGLRAFCSQGIQQGRYSLACIEVCMAFQYVPVHNILPVGGDL